MTSILGLLPIFGDIGDCKDAIWHVFFGFAVPKGQSSKEAVLVDWRVVDMSINGFV